MIKSVKIEENFRDLDKIEEMMTSLFPANERAPFPDTVRASSLPGVAFNAYYDDALLIGLSFTIETDKAIYLLYLGVNNKVQSKGYGGKILEAIKGQNPGKNIFLSIEALDPAATNNEQRTKRLEFYRRHDFDTFGADYSFGEDKYTALSLRKDAVPQDFADFFKALLGEFANSATASSAAASSATASSATASSVRRTSAFFHENFKKS